MFEDYESSEAYFEDSVWGTGVFDEDPRLDPADAAFINHALANDNPAHALKALRQLERQNAFNNSVQARLVTHIDAMRSKRDQGRVNTTISTTQRGTAQMVAIARHKTQQGALSYLPRVRNLVTDMPFLFSRLEKGLLTEEQVLAILLPFDLTPSTEREQFDRYYETHPQMFAGASVHQAKELAQKAVDLANDVQRTAAAEKQAEQRFVRVERQQDHYRLKGKLPLEVGLALTNFLNEQAHKIHQAGDPRTVSQLRADVLVASATGQPIDKPLPVKLHVNLVITDRTLFLQDSGMAVIPGYGNIPAEYARKLVAEHEDQETIKSRLNAMPMFRRLFTNPSHEDLVSMDSKERLYKGQLRHLVQLRDPYCRTPYCSNNPRHADHVLQAHKGGETSFSNGDMKCGACNLAKEAPGWTEQVVSQTPHRILIEPTPGISFTSTSPPLTGLARLAQIFSEADQPLPPVPIRHPVKECIPSEEDFETLDYFDPDYEAAYTAAGFELEARVLAGEFEDANSV